MDKNSIKFTAADRPKV